MTRAALWIRVSTREQNAENQLPELRAYAERRGFEVVTEYRLDDASAFKAEHRHQLAEAMQDARLGKFDVLLVWALDRLSREGVEAMLSIMRRFRDQGVMVWSLRESWTETSDPRMAELLGAIFGWMAAEESRHRSERTKAGLARRRAAGLPVGRQPGAVDRKPRRRSGYVARFEDPR